MEIHFERSGGFAGMRIQADIDSEQLPIDDAITLSSLLRDANFFALPSTMKTSGGADQFQYEITVDTGEQRHTVRVGDQSAPESLRPLLQHLTQLARSQPGT